MRSRLARICLGTAFVVGSGLGVIAVSATPALAQATTFTTPGCVTWAVPTGVTTVHISAVGAAGGSNSSFGSNDIGGDGDGVSAVLSGLTAGQNLDVCVDVGGGAGGSAGNSFASNGNGGGGASGVALGANFNTPIIVAGGGGGGSGEGDGNGGNAGNNGSGDCCGQGDGGGGAGTATSGGAGGSGNGTANGYNGSAFGPTGPGAGGAGGSGAPCCSQAGGGGGGGGYYGGGGGAAGGGGGGGGSDLCSTMPSITGCTVTSGAGTQTTAGSQAGDAQVQIQAMTSITATPAILRLSPTNLYAFTLNATLTFQATGAGIGGQTVTFTAESAIGSTTICTATTNSAGLASCSGLASAVQIILADGYTASFAGQGVYAASSTTAPLIA